MLDIVGGLDFNFTIGLKHVYHLFIMDQPILYAKHYNGMINNYSGIESGEKLLNICEGIYQRRSTRGNKIYPVLRQLGTVNITARRFVKGSKHPRKIIRHEGDRVVLFNYHNQDADYTYTPLTILFAELGYSETLLGEITNVVITASNDKTIYSSDYNRVGGENDGIVYF
jgi:hypothetical protein